jgi:uncharacterized OB-fold protein
VTVDGSPPTEGRPLPAPDHLSAEYWRSAADGKVLYQECPACGHRQFYPRVVCTKCGATPEWRTASGKGTVHTFTVIRQNYAAPFREQLPYVVAMVELDEGPRMMTNLTGCEPDDVRVGMPVEAYTVPVDEEIGLPFWRPAAGA